MRISVIKEDPGFSPDSYKYKVQLNDLVLEDCVTADEELGLAVVYARNSDRTYMIQNNEIVKETLFGKVKIIEPDMKVA